MRMNKHVMPETGSSRFLLRLSMATYLDDRERSALASMAERVVEVPARRDIVHEGEPFDRGFIVDWGWACRYTILSDGRRQILNFLIPGDHVGNAAAVFERADHSIATLSPARLSVFPSETLSDLAGRYAGIRAAFDWSTQCELAVARARLVDVGRRAAYQRLAHLILELHHRLQLVALAGDDPFVLPLTQEMLADALGLTIVHINRTVRHLREQGLICFSNGRLTILDADRLARVADFDKGYLHCDAPRGADARRRPVRDSARTLVAGRLAS